ncbi:hypothetical protein ACFY64_40170 [Streptomyces collinus]
MDQSDKETLKVMAMVAGVSMVVIGVNGITERRWEWHVRVVSSAG